MDRLEMIKKMSHYDFHNGSSSLHFFDSHMNDHYNEIYCMYNILKENDVSLDDIEFVNEPLSDGDKFIVYIEFDNKVDRKNINDYLKRNNNVITANRNIQCKVLLIDDTIIFKTL